MRHWKPKLTISFWIAAALLLVVLAATLFVALQLRTQVLGDPESWQVNLRMYAEVVLLLGLVVIAGMLAYRVAAALTLHYELDRNGMYILWLGNRAVIPLERIQSVDLGMSTEQAPLGPLQSLGYYWGRVKSQDGKTVHRFTTQPAEQSLVVQTPEAAYLISPENHNAFVQDLEQRRNLGATKPLQISVQTSRIFLYDFWSDRIVRTMLLVAVALNLIVLGILAARYPSLASEVWMRFNESGQAAAPRPRHQVLFLPLAAFGLTVLNTGLGLLMYRREQLGARLLQGASIVVQLLFGIAVITIIR